MWLRAQASASPALAQALFGRTDRIPMIFQYDPCDDCIETVPGVGGAAELVVTVNRPMLSPRIRYVGDEGGRIDFASAMAACRGAGLDPSAVEARPFRLPFLFVRTRDDPDAADGMTREGLSLSRVDWAALRAAFRLGRVPAPLALVYASRSCGCCRAASPCACSGLPVSTRPTCSAPVAACCGPGRRSAPPAGPATRSRWPWTGPRPHLRSPHWRAPTSRRRLPDRSPHGGGDPVGPPAPGRHPESPLTGRAQGAVPDQGPEVRAYLGWPRLATGYSSASGERCSPKRSAGAWPEYSAS